MDRVTLMLAFVFIGMSYVGHVIETLRWFSYNNPFLMVACIGLFMWISRLSLQSKIINIIATGMFGVFLLHTTPFVIPFRNEVTSQIFADYSYAGILIEACVIMAVSCVISLLLNKITKPIIGYVVEKSRKYIFHASAESFNAKQDVQDITQGYL